MPEQSITPRQLSDRYVDELVALDPLVATSLGLPDGADRFGDLSPAGSQQRSALRRRTLSDLDALESAGTPRAVGAHASGSSGDERRCARLLRERLTAAEAVHEAGEGLRSLGTLFSPLQQVRGVFALMPTATDENWTTIARRMSAVPQALQGYIASLDEGRRQGLPAGPAQVDAVVVQLGQWLAAGDGSGWFREFAGKGPDTLRTELDRGAAAADAAVAGLRDWLRDGYAAFAVEHGSDPVGRERYARSARYWTGSDLDLDDTYTWGWQEYARLSVELRAEADRVLPGAGVRAAMRYLDTDGPAIEGVEQVREYLQGLMDDTIADLDSKHFTIADPLKTVEAMIAPAGSAAAPYYTRPSLDFARPGRTWLPTLGRTRFPVWDLISTWYHEGVPGHHLQLAQWSHVSGRLSRYQTSVGSVGADVEGWALYAERLMDELGYLADPGHRLGYLDAQRMRAVRVIIDIGMHLELEIPRDQGGAEPFHPGERWTPALARDFFGRNSGRPADYLDSELIRYLGGPGQAISYKLGERAWLAGREAARAAHARRGEEFDLRAWHMAALSQGSLGLDDLVDELGALQDAGRPCVRF
ncbi:MAG TPA: DUF885 domain-containing protein [Kineosporiaceae bacterium]|nr:DUF885 domain-containing protein [Kineosporiaceae bacterium]